MMKYILIILVTMVTQAAMAADIPDASSPDAQVYENSCAVCHVLPHPGRLDWPGWRNILYQMEKRMDERGFEKPTKEEWQAIARYLKSHAH
jgi:hypothetical protein